MEDEDLLKELEQYTVKDPSNKRQSRSDPVPSQIQFPTAPKTSFVQKEKEEEEELRQLTRELAM